MDLNEKQIEVRIKHQIDIINILRKGKATILELANNLHISITAITTIVEELIQEGVLIYSGKNKTAGRGRKPIFVELNNNLGVVCYINFSMRDLRIVLATLDSQIIAEDVVPNFGLITKEILSLAEEKIRKLLTNPNVNNRPLLSICIVSPGIFRESDYSYVASRKVSPEDLTKINPVLYFSNAFNVRVEMYNDVKIECYGEMKYGVFPKEVFNGLFIHLGYAAGITLITDGKIYKGSNNFSGETASYNYDCEDEILQSSIYSGRFYTFWEIFIKICKLNNLDYRKETFDLDKLIRDYDNNDPITVQAIEESAKRNAITLIDFTTFLDIEYIVIDGEILRFGNRYIDLLRKYISMFSALEIRARFIISSLDKDWALLGACYRATSIFLFDKLEETAKKRTKYLSFVLDKSFKEL